ncbi:MAG: ROK family transcriptional regulator [Anaerolineae bacterium]|nr:ROK family transcriptional regulator [Anaerolineae bacterium]
MSPKLSTPFLVTAQQADIIRAMRRRGVISRTDIAMMTGWSRAKITNEVGLLIDKNFIKEVGDGKSEGGRRPRLLSINNDLGFLVGVDIGATSVDLALADVCGHVFQRRSEAADVSNPPDVLLGRVSEVIHEMAQAQQIDPGKIYGIGVGVPGPVEFSRGTLVAPPLMPDWDNFSVRRYFEAAFPSAFVMVDNDVNIMALGEFYTSGKINPDNFIFVKIGTGIGAGIISNGKIHRGDTGCAGDIGHICVDKTGPVCRCGNKGCLESISGGRAIAERAMAAAMNNESPILARHMAENGGFLRAEDVGMAQREGDRVAAEIIQYSGKMIGEGLAGLVNFFNPSHIILGGGVTGLGNQFLANIRQSVLKRSTPLATRHLVIEYSRMGTEAGITGAISLLLEYLFYVSDDVP